MHDNTNLNRAISTQDDEFYTSLRDIEQEMRHYEPQLRGKRIYSNCDGQQSNFVKYFEMHGDRLGIIWHRWSQDDYAASHNIDTLHEADIIITNPPFTLMREYVATLIGCRKRFLIVAPVHAITKKSIFPRFKEDAIRFGHAMHGMQFTRPDGTSKGVPACWLTNLDVIDKRYHPSPQSMYLEGAYPTYDNVDAIEVSEGKFIPCDYDGAMGVPITYMVRMNPAEFEVIDWKRVYLGGKELFARILIRRR